MDPGEHRRLELALGKKSSLTKPIFQEFRTKRPKGNSIENGPELGPDSIDRLQIELAPSPNRFELEPAGFGPRNALKIEFGEFGQI